MNTVYVINAATFHTTVLVTNELVRRGARVISVNHGIPSSGVFSTTGYEVWFEHERAWDEAWRGEVCAVVIASGGWLYPVDQVVAGDGGGSGE